ncbi:uncharacterized protein [Choristoneura fumiferana]|uniref:uncharacterized protein n=1 Tax=Choristoneura fumiferana TaxID=7141 RepID=UPI003D156EAC
MTSPRAPPPPRPAAGSNGNSNERTVAKKQRRASLPGRASGARADPAPAPGEIARAPPGGRRRSSSSGSDSGGSSLLCAAPRWLAARRRRPRPARPGTARGCRRRRPARGGRRGRLDGDGGGLVPRRAAGRRGDAAALPARCGAPRAPRPRAPAPPPTRADTDATPRRSVATRSDETGTTECWCRCCGAPAPQPPAAPRSRRASLSLAVRKEEYSPLTRKGKKKPSHTHLPELEQSRGGGERRRSARCVTRGAAARAPPPLSQLSLVLLQVRRACSLQCWLPAAAPRRAGGQQLAVEGSAIVPELKPRAPSMSERDLTRRPPAPPSCPACPAHRPRPPYLRL